MTEKRIGLASVAAYLPPERITNDDLSKLVDTNDEWIVRRTGIKERRISREAGTSALGIEASREALEKAPGKIDLIVGSTSTSEQSCPYLSVDVGAALSLGKVPGFDVNMACSGFPAALTVAYGLMKTSGMERSLVVASDRMTRFLDYSDRASCILFGDGAAAAVLTTVEPFHEILAWEMGGDPAGNEKVRYGGQGDRFHFHQDGTAVFKFAVETICARIASLKEKLGLTDADVLHVVPHQGNLRMLESVSEKLGIPMERISATMDRFGNTSSASVGIALAEAQANYKEGDYVFLIGFGGGLSWSAVAIRW